MYVDQITIVECYFLGSRRPKIADIGAVEAARMSAANEQAQLLSKKQFEALNSIHKASLVVAEERLTLAGNRLSKIEDQIKEVSISLAWLDWPMRAQLRLEWTHFVS